MSLCPQISTVMLFSKMLSLEMMAKAIYLHVKVTVQTLVVDMLTHFLEQSSKPCQVVFGTEPIGHYITVPYLTVADSHD